MFKTQTTSTPAQPARSAVKIVASANGKGGCGKTMLSYNLAILWAAAGKRVVFVDTDRQAQGAVLALGVDPANDFYNFAVGAGDVRLIEVRHNLWVMPSNEMAVAAEATLSSMRKPRTWLRDRLLDPSGPVMALNPDIILIDTASQGYLAEMAVHAANLIVAPTPLRTADADGLTTFAGQIRDFFPNGSAPRVRIIPNRYDRRTYQSKTILSMIAANLAEATAADAWFAKWGVTDPVAESVDMDRAMNERRSIGEYAPNSEAARSVGAVAQALLEMLA